MILIDPPGPFESAATWREHVKKLERLVQVDPVLQVSLDAARHYLAAAEKAEEEGFLPAP
jgi:hypothetical protein